jgi:hypothetical protein
MPTRKQRSPLKSEQFTAPELKRINMDPYTAYQIVHFEMMFDPPPRTRSSRRASHRTS